jgi:hypothetical protein
MPVLCGNLSPPFGRNPFGVAPLAVVDVPGRLLPIGLSRGFPTQHPLKVYMSSII